MRTIEIGKLYKHFKNKLYQVIDIVNDSESNNDEHYRKIVIYKALYGEGLTWARDYDMFNSEVDHEKYPDVEQKYRFEEYYRDYSMGLNAFVTSNISKELEDSLKDLNINTFMNEEDLDLFSTLRTSDILIVDYDNMDEISNIAIGYAKSNNVPIYVISKKGNNISNFLDQIVEEVIFYDDINEIHNEFKALIDNNELKTNINTFKK